MLNTKTWTIRKSPLIYIWYTLTIYVNLKPLYNNTAWKP